jgi:hypothetical protein
VAVVFRQQNQSASRFLFLDRDTRLLQRCPEVIQFSLATDIQASLTPAETGADILQGRLELFLMCAKQRTDMITLVIRKSGRTDHGASLLSTNTG